MNHINYVTTIDFFATAMIRRPFNRIQAIYLCYTTVD